MLPGCLPPRGLASHSSVHPYLERLTPLTQEPHRHPFLQEARPDQSHPGLGVPPLNSCIS